MRNTRAGTFPCPDALLPWALGSGAFLASLLGYFAARWRARRRQRAALRERRRWRKETLADWNGRGWLTPGSESALPAALSPAEVFAEWAWVDPDAPRRWRFRRTVAPHTPVEELVRDAWEGLPQSARAASEQRLELALLEAGTWWGGAQKGWNRRPLALLASALGKKQQALPLLPVDDLTGAPDPLPVDTSRAAREGSGPERILLLAALRRAAPTFTHPLAPGAKSGASMLGGLSTQVATDVGRRVGAGLGAALGPIGSMVGQYLGEMAGTLGGKALTTQVLPAGIAGPLQETETALARLGELAAADGFSRAAAQPAESVLEFGGRLETVRSARSRGLRERLWPTPGVALIEETMRLALDELKGYRGAADHFVSTARKAPPAVAGGMLLQNPWLVRTLPEGVERLNAARAALNRAAAALKRAL